MKGGGLTLEDIAKYNLGSYKTVTIEKGEGLIGASSNSKAEERMVTACQLVKSQLPNMPCFTYVNQLLDWKYYDIHDQYESLLGSDASIVNYKANGDKTFPNFVNLNVYNFANPKVKDWWVQSVGDYVDAAVAQGHIDGVFVDRAYIGLKKETKSIKIGKKLKKTHDLKIPQVYDAYAAGKEAALDALAARGTSLIANPGGHYYVDGYRNSMSQYTFDNYLKNVDWVHLETFCVDSWFILKLNQAVKSGKKVQAHGGSPLCSRKYKCSKDVRAFLSVFLMGIEDHTSVAGEAAGFAEATFACHRYWSLDSDEDAKVGGEYLGFGEYSLLLGVPGDRVRFKNIAQKVPIKRKGIKQFSALRPFRNEDTGELQAVAVWSGKLKTVCFVNDCTANLVPTPGNPYCQGNSPQCQKFLDLFSS